ncbi:3-oxoacyl-ACP reductase family protein [Pseudogracilibacillus auburnensis]|uniref:3-oxoacyl-[acyl-carrier protein] reductase n=1 Tax=Pseudogracilibacillus auburnensis TaxID=1494959 RepID=A0A2V3VWB8_9BACI|nr:3-oxoacyl-ACP reductase family protein [Pseudogracilibacillus auburnensis]PXW85121.1 3-oxoacyl-[acyl-carrier protein] reductase [Pseudogracilibacillus auburnensis]
MTLSLKNKVALVTGGSRGIGAAIVKKLAQEGAHVAFTYIHSEEKAQDVVAKITDMGQRGLAIRADSGNSKEIMEAVERTVDEFNRLDILVNNAGIFPTGLLENITLEEIDHTLAVNVRGVFLASQAALKHLGKGGRIISIGSCFAHHVPKPGISLYAMSKSALIGFTKGLARDVGSRHITVNVVDPGSTDTDMNPANSPNADEKIKLLALDHYGEGKDIAAMVGFLASESGRFITGTCIAVDGGFGA